MADFRIRVIVDPADAKRGAAQVKRRLVDLEKSADRLRATIQRALAFGVLVVGVRKLLELADTFQRIQNRLRIVTNSQAELVLVTERLFQVSRKTRSSFTATAELFARLAINARELGRSQEELLQFTESLNKAIIISGASAKEANSALIQLSQGLASGTLRGDELRSVLEQLPVVADVIAREILVTRGELRLLGQEGKISSDIIITAFANAKEELDVLFEKTIPTISQSFQVLQNSILKVFGEFENNSGVAEAFSRGVLFLADNFEEFVRIVEAAAVALGIIFAKKAINAAVSGLSLLKKALLTNPLTLLPAFILIVTSLLIAFGDKIRISGDSFATLQDVAVSAFTEIKAVVADVTDALKIVFEDVGILLDDVFGDFEFTFRDVLIFMGVFADSTIGLFTATFLASVAVWKNLPRALGDLAIRTANGLIDGFESAVDQITALFKTLAKTVDILGFGITDSFRLAGQGAMAFLTGDFETAEQRAKESAEAIKNATIRAFEGVPDTLGRELAAASETDLIPKIENVFEGGAEDLGAAVSAAIEEGLAFDSLSGFVSRVLGGAEELALARQRRLAKEASDRAIIEKAFGEGGESVITESEKKRALALIEVTEKLGQEQSLLSKVNQEREVAADLLRIELALRQKGIELGPDERKDLIDQLQRLQLLRDRADVLDSIQQPQENLRRTQAAINELFKSGVEDVGQFNDMLLNLKIAALEGSTSLEDGFKRGFLVIEQQVGNIADIATNTLVSAFNSASDALTEFVTTGKVDFKEFARSLLADVTRMISQLLLLEALKSASGIPGLEFLAPKPAQLGATARPNESFLVGEEGPELFQPTTAGRIIPNQESMAVVADQMGSRGKGQPVIIQNQPPPVNVNVSNQLDPREVVAAGLESDEGERTLINVIRKNKRNVKRELGV